MQIEDSSETPATPHIIQQCGWEGGSILRLGGQQFFFSGARLFSSENPHYFWAGETFFPKNPRISQYFLMK